MNYPFNAQRGLIVIQAEIQGPSGSIVLRLALDTGATGTMINVAPLITIGYDPSLAPDRVQVTTGSGGRICTASLRHSDQGHGSGAAEFPSSGAYPSSECEHRRSFGIGFSARANAAD